VPIYIFTLPFHPSFTFNQFLHLSHCLLSNHAFCSGVILSLFLVFPHDYKYCHLL